MADNNTPATSLLEALKQLKDIQAQARKLADAAAAVLKTARSGRNVTLFAGEHIAAAEKTARKVAEEAARFNLPAACATVNEELKNMDLQGRITAEKEAMRLLADLSDKLSSAGLSLEGHYPELTCTVLTLRFDLTQSGMVTTVFYGPEIEKLDSVTGTDVQVVYKAVTSSLEKLDKGLSPDEEFLPALFKAWQTASAVNSGRTTPGPQPILDVLSALSFRKQSQRFHRNPVRSAFQSYGQAQFSYQLFKLGARTFDKHSLSLGIATRDDVKQRSSLWVPRNLKGAGNHYATLEFRSTE